MNVIEGPVRGKSIELTERDMARQVVNEFLDRTPAIPGYLEMTCLPEREEIINICAGNIKSELGLITCDLDVTGRYSERPDVDTLAQLVKESILSVPETNSFLRAAVDPENNRTLLFLSHPPSAAWEIQGADSDTRWEISTLFSNSVTSSYYSSFFDLIKTPGILVQGIDIDKLSCVSNMFEYYAFTWVGEVSEQNLATTRKICGLLQSGLDYLNPFTLDVQHLRDNRYLFIIK